MLDEILQPVRRRGKLAPDFRGNRIALPTLSASIVMIALLCALGSFFCGAKSSDLRQRSLHAADDLVCLRAQHKKEVPDYEWLASMKVRQKAQVNPGNAGRLRAAMGRYQQGGNLTIAVVGGSIAAGQGAFDGEAFPMW